MSYRLSQSPISETRVHFKNRQEKSKHYFFVEGSRTEILYLDAWRKKINETSRDTIFVFDRVTALSSHSNQLKIVESTRDYLKTCQGLGRKKRNFIDQILEKVEYGNYSIEKKI